MDLNTYDLIIINSSAGKDSLCAIFEMCRLASLQQYPKSRIIVSHQDLGRMEWPGTKEMAAKQANHFGLQIRYAHRSFENQPDTILSYATRRGKWPSSQQRWCTSDFKRTPGATVVTDITANMSDARILYVFGFRKSESTARSKKKVKSVCENLTFVNAHRSRVVREFLPIHKWTESKVWQTIKKHNLPYHSAYDLGMPRLSCVFCIFSPFDALVIAGKSNPELLDQYVAVEKQINHKFKADLSLADVKSAILNGYQPKKIPNWVM